MTRLPRLLDRVVQQRRQDAKQEEAAPAGGTRETQGEVAGGATPETQGEVAGGATPETREETLEDRVAMLENRLNHLETLVESLQDSVHRQSTRQQRQIEALGRKTDPAEMARSLGRHSRQRGL